MDVRDHRQPGWLWANNELIDVYGPLIGANGIALYVALARFAGQDSKAWPALATLSAKTKLSRPTVIKALAALQEHGLITIAKRTTIDGDPDTNLYTLLSISGGGKAGLPPSKEALPRSQADLPRVVNDVDQGSKAALPELDTVNKTQLEEKTTSLPLQVQVYIDNGGEFPSGKLRDGTTKKAKAIQYITDRVSADSASLSRWGRIVERYSAQWSAKSYTVMVTDYYDCGRIPGERNGANHTPGTDKVSRVLAAKARERAERGEDDGNTI